MCPPIRTACHSHLVSFSSNPPVEPYIALQHHKNGTGDEVETSTAFSATQEKGRKCFHCGRQGHVKLDCFHNPESSKYRRATNSHWVGRYHSGSGNSNKSASKTGSGYITFFVKCLTSPMKVSKIKNKWFIDSGATSLLTNSKILSKLSNQNNFPAVSVGNGYQTSVAGVGTI